MNQSSDNGKENQEVLLTSNSRHPPMFSEHMKTMQKFLKLELFNIYSSGSKMYERTSIPTIMFGSLEIFGSISKCFEVVRKFV